MPVHMVYENGMWVVKDKAGKVKQKYKKREDARKYVAAFNINTEGIKAPPPKKK